MYKIVFMGSPDFAVPTLRKLVEQFQVIGIVTQPDRPAGRGRLVKSPPIKVLAEEFNLPVIQPRKLGEPEAIQQLKQWSPDVIVVAAFGQILRTEVLNLPRFGCVNVHASLLPRWRGAAPVQAAILNGDVKTGITIMLMDQGIDTGPIISQASIQLVGTETSGTLSSQLAEMGSNLLVSSLPLYLDGRLLPQPQDELNATYAPMIHKDAGLLDFSQSAINLERKIRAYNPWPGAYTLWKNQPLKIHTARAINAQFEIAGKRIMLQELPAFTTSNGVLVVHELQPAGKNIMDGKTFLRGARGWEE